MTETETTHQLSPQSSVLSTPPGPRSWPWYTLARFTRAPLQTMLRDFRRYGPVVHYEFPRGPLVLFVGPEANQYILAQQPRRFVQRPVLLNLVPLLGEGLFTSDGSFHDQQRRLVQPAFHKQHIDGYQQIMRAATERRLARWRPGQVLDVSREMQALTLEIVAEALLGVQITDETEAIGRAFAEVGEHLPRRVVSLRNLHLDVPFLPYGRFLRARRLLDEAVYGTIARHRAAAVPDSEFLVPGSESKRTNGRQPEIRHQEPKTGTEGHRNIVSLLLEARDEDGAMLTDEQIRDQVMTFFAAGHATTALAMTWSLFLLAQHPEALSKLLQEFAQVLDGRPPEPADLARLIYLGQAVTESLRLYPPAWSGVRLAIEPFELHGYRFDAGTAVLFSQYLTHRLPEYYPEPEAFLPERWAPDTARAAARTDAAHQPGAADPQRRDAIPHWAYIPFGGGPRACIGMPFALMEIKTLLPMILQRFHLAPVSPQTIEVTTRITLVPKHGIQMTVAPRAGAVPPASASVNVVLAGA